MVHNCAVLNGAISRLQRKYCGEDGKDLEQVSAVFKQLEQVIRDTATKQGVKLGRQHVPSVPIHASVSASLAPAKAVESSTTVHASAEEIIKPADAHISAATATTTIVSEASTTAPVPVHPDVLKMRDALAALRSKAASTNVALRSILILDKLFSSSDSKTAVEQALVDDGGVTILLAALVIHMECKEVVAGICQMLAYLVDDRPVDAHVISEAGGVSTLLACMKKYKDSLSIATHVCWVLFGIADTVPGGVKMIGEEGKEAVAQAIKLHAGNTTLLDAAQMVMKLLK
jgi:hypothetical protein